MPDSPTEETYQRPSWGSTGVYRCHYETPEGGGGVVPDPPRVYEDTLSVTAFGSFAMVGHDGPYRARMSPQDLIDFGTDLVKLGRAMQADQ